MSTNPNNCSACRKCGGAMKTGKAIAETYTSGLTDFPGDARGITVSAGGPGRMVDCLKCESCGHSIAASTECPKASAEGAEQQ